MESFLGINLGTHQVEAQSNVVQIVPNPVENVLNIHSNNNQAIHSVIVSDMSGRMVMNGNYNGNSLDVSNLKKGIYLATITTDTGSFTHKIVKK